MTKNENVKRFGCHVSVAGGVSRAFERGVELGCGAMQIFSRNQRQWQAHPLDPVEIERFHEERERTGIAPVMVHDSYLINLCAPDKDILKKSRDAFADEIARAEALQADFLNFHPGAHRGKGEEWGIKTVAESINICNEQYPKASVTLLLETTAGQGSNLGDRFEHLRRIIDRVDGKERMGVCFDTAHIFSAGYDIRTEAAYAATMSELDDIIGLDAVRGFHVNDSKRELGSRVDRHENLGDGLIGLQAFEFLLNDERHARKPMLLETPGGDPCFKKNLEIMCSLVHEHQKNGR